MIIPAKFELRILLLEDSDLDAELITREIRSSGLEFISQRAQTAGEFERDILGFRPDVILSDYQLPTINGTQALALAKSLCPDIPFILVSGAVGEEKAVDLLKNGATDFVLKDRLSARLVPALQRALREVRERKARKQAEENLQSLNEQLEVRVTERTRELREKNVEMEEDLKMARELQVALLPHHFPTIPRGASQSSSAVKFFSIYHPTDSVSGDFFNVLRVSDNAVGLFICDVMGHGVRAALVTSMMRALEEEIGETGVDPGALLTEMNRALRSILRESDTTLFATACYLIADISATRVTLANAGHPSPLLVRSSSGEVLPLTAPRTAGPALGLFDNVHYHTYHYQVNPSDLILLFTDGLFEVENSNSEAFSETRLRESVRRRAGNPPQKLLQDVFSEIENFADGQPFTDDVCLVGMEISKLQTNGESKGVS